MFLLIFFYYISSGEGEENTSSCAITWLLFKTLEYVFGGFMEGFVGWLVLASFIY